MGVFLSANAAAMEPLEAVRLLQQGTFGPSQSDVNRLENMTAEQWVDEQLMLPPTFQYKGQDFGRRPMGRYRSWFHSAFYSEDQLRQRMAFALSQIFVVSQAGTKLHNHQSGLVTYYDTLIKHGLGNYRDLMYDVTMHPAMGVFLTYAPNNAAPANSAQEADENYARELLQLMSIGLYELNMDGTFKLENGERIETYTQDHIKAFAKVFTGFCFQDIRRDSGNYTCDDRFGDYTVPLIRALGRHDKTEKRLFPTPEHPDGQILAANSGMSHDEFEDEVDAALDNIFAHPNVAPFVSERLIKMLVTSNPSPNYIKDVASVFNDNGQGVKGDLAAVAKAILLHNEARHGHINDTTVFGKVREPLLALTHYYRVLDVWQDGDTPEYGFYGLADSLFSAPMMAPSVFNFYQFNYAHPLLTRAAAPGDIDPPDIPSEEIVQLESDNYPNHFIHHYGDGKQVRIDNSTDNIEATKWKIVPGIAGETGTISLESVDTPNHYLRHKGGGIYLDAYTNTNLYRQDASWKARGDVSWIGETQTSDQLTCVNQCALESLNYGNEYMRHKSWVLIRTPINSVLDQADSTFSFHLVEPIQAPDSNTLPPASVGENTVSPVLGVYAEDAMLNGFNFIFHNILKRPEANRAHGQRIVSLIGNKTDEEVENAINYIDLMFTSGEMSDAMRNEIKHIMQHQSDRYRSVRDTMMMLFTSPDFMVQR
ncbi:hypothetical protein GCM10007877_04130 [Marinibactrum halimedae]|uniref:DUF1800 domain-containing protein n=2 Tax=Marinibactrum halimedae TaxID=1444977 RepID=A0AA37T283_9GAMM|nr:hypothetical protein GCM10007877_04130 [Marinibactrum halimedae]